MSNDIQIFNNPQFGSIRTAGTPEQPLFCLADVCKILGLQASRVKDRLEKGVISSNPLLTSGGIQQLNFVNEDGLYDVILDSRKPEAKAFRKWVTSEVLPTIRKHGAYMTNDAIERALTEPDFLIQLATSIKEERSKRLAVEAVCEEQRKQISQLGYEHVQANYIERFGQIQTPAEVQKEMFVKIAGDALINRKSGIGTMLDPSVYTHSQIPVMLGPWEGSSVYAPGGLPATIIDKKARGMVMHGASFKSENKELWTNDKIEQMEAAAEITGFNDQVSDASADAYIYGGSILYPVF